MNRLILRGIDYAPYLTEQRGVDKIITNYSVESCDLLTCKYRANKECNGTHIKIPMIKHVWCMKGFMELGEKDD